MAETPEIPPASTTPTAPPPVIPGAAPIEGGTAADVIEHALDAFLERRLGIPGLNTRYRTILLLVTFLLTLRCAIGPTFAATLNGTGTVSSLVRLLVGEQLPSASTLPPGVPGIPIPSPVQGETK